MTKNHKVTLIPGTESDSFILAMLSHSARSNLQVKLIHDARKLLEKVQSQDADLSLDSSFSSFHSSGALKQKQEPDSPSKFKDIVIVNKSEFASPTPQSNPFVGTSVQQKSEGVLNLSYSRSERGEEYISDIDDSEDECVPSHPEQSNDTRSRARMSGSSSNSIVPGLAVASCSSSHRSRDSQYSSKSDALCDNHMSESPKLGPEAICSVDLKDTHLVEGKDVLQEKHASTTECTDGMDLFKKKFSERKEDIVTDDDHGLGDDHGSDCDSCEYSSASGSETTKTDVLLSSAKKLIAIYSTKSSQSYGSLSSSGTANDEKSTSGRPYNSQESPSSRDAAKKQKSAEGHSSNSSGSLSSNDTVNSQRCTATGSSETKEPKQDTEMNTISTDNHDIPKIESEKEYVDEATNYDISENIFSHMEKSLLKPNMATCDDTALNMENDECAGIVKNHFNASNDDHLNDIDHENAPNDTKATIFVHDEKSVSLDAADDRGASIDGADSIGNFEGAVTRMFEKNLNDDKSKIDSLREENRRLQEQNESLQEEMNLFDEKLAYLELSLGLIQSMERTKSDLGSPVCETEIQSVEDLVEPNVESPHSSVSKSKVGEERDNLDEKSFLSAASCEMGSSQRSQGSGSYLSAESRHVGTCRSNSQDCSDVQSKSGTDGTKSSVKNYETVSSSEMHHELNVLRENNQKMLYAIQALSKAITIQIRKHFHYKKKFGCTKKQIEEDNVKLTQLVAEKDEITSNFYKTRAQFLEEQDKREELSHSVQHLAKIMNDLRRKLKSEEEIKSKILDRIDENSTSGASLPLSAAASSSRRMSSLSDNEETRDSLDEILSPRSQSSFNISVQTANDSGKSESGKSIGNLSLELEVMKLRSKLERRDAKIVRLQKKFDMIKGYLKTVEEGKEDGNDQSK